MLLRELYIENESTKTQHNESSLDQIKTGMDGLLIYTYLVIKNSIKELITILKQPENSFQMSVVIFA